MSRVAKNPIVLPQGVDVALSAEVILVKGPLGAIQFAANPAVSVEMENGTLLCKAVEGVANSGALSGTVRAIVANMVTAGLAEKLIIPNGPLTEINSAPKSTSTPWGSTIGFFATRDIASP